nr:uncharacterized protein LOC117690981 [Crassostrea gigas]
MGEFTELFQLMIIAIGLFPSINKGIQILFGSPRFKKRHGGIGPRKESRTKQHSVEETPSPVEAEEENIHLNSPESKHMTSTKSSPTLNGLTCTYKGHEVPDTKTEKRVEFNGNNAGGRKRKVEPKNKTALAMNLQSSSQKVTVIEITRKKYKMSDQRHCSRKHGSTRENKPTTTKSIIIKISNREVFKGSQKTFNKKMGKRKEKK